TTRRREERKACSLARVGTVHLAKRASGSLCTPGRMPENNHRERHTSPVTCTEGTMADRTTQKPTHYLTSKRCLDDLRTRIGEDAATGSERTTILSKLLEQLTAATRAHAEASPQEEQDAPPVVVDAATYVTLFRGYASYRRIAGAALAVLAAALQQVEQQ